MYNTVTYFSFRASDTFTAHVITIQQYCINNYISTHEILNILNRSSIMITNFTTKHEGL